MEVFEVTKRQFARLKPIPLPKSVIHTESELYLSTQGGGYSSQELIKKFYCTEGKIYESKLTVIRYLIENLKKEQMPELILPERLFIMDKEVCGYTMPYVFPSVNLKSLLEQREKRTEDFKRKLLLLKEVLKLLEKVEKQELFDGTFFLGDIHENNFIYNVKEKRVQAVDLDSSRIYDSLAPVSKYLSGNLLIDSFPLKYPRDSYDNPIPNHNTTYLSFIYMLLNTISKTNLFCVSFNQYYEYIEYLKSLGLAKEVIEALQSVFSSKENYFCKEYLDAFLEVSYEKLSYKKMQ